MRLKALGAAFKLIRYVCHSDQLLRFSCMCSSCFLVILGIGPGQSGDQFMEIGLNLHHRMFLGLII